MDHGAEKPSVRSLLFLHSAVVYLRFLSARENRRNERNPYLYFLSLGLFVLALLSKTVACTLPAALLLVQWWKQDGRLVRKDFLRLVPFVLIGASLGVLTVWLERHQVRAEGTAFALSFGQRVIIAGRALWFYAAKLFWPFRLAFIYPRWEANVTSLAQWLFPMGAAGILVGLWATRNRFGRGPLVGVLFFVLTLSPALGFFNVFPFRYSFVADHFQYLASIGLLALAAAALSAGPRAMSAAVCLGLAFLTWRQTAVYQNLESLWRDTVRKNQDSWMAHNSLGMALMRTGSREEAMAHLERAVQLEPNTVETENDYGYALLGAGRIHDAFPYLRKAAEIDPNYAAVHFNCWATRYCSLERSRSRSWNLRKP